MGTHPIFESEFDCLTDQFVIEIVNFHQKDPISCQCCRKKGGKSTKKEDEAVWNIFTGRAN